MKVYVKLKKKLLLVLLISRNYFLVDLVYVIKLKYTTLSGYKLKLIKTDVFSESA